MDQDIEYVSMEQYKETIQKILKRIRATETRLEQLELQNNEQAHVESKLSNMKFKFTKEDN